MEQHPVPQNVTSFQFRLIGDMTLKQFGYLAGGAMVGYICYKLPLPVFITFPLGVGVFLFGFGLAFVPIEERPMDVWVLAFLKSIYSPTLYIWQREKPVQEPPVSQKPLSPRGIGVQKPSALPETSLPMIQKRPVQPVLPQKTQPVQPAPVPPLATRTPSQRPELHVLEGLFSSPQKQTPARTATHPVPPPNTTLPAVTRPETSGPSPHKRGGFFAWLNMLFQPKPSGPKPSGPKPSKGPVETMLPGVVAGPTVPVTGRPLQVPGFSSPQAGPATKLSPNASVDKESVQAEVKKLDDAQNKTRELEKKLTNLQEELTKKTTSEARILELQKQLTEVLSERSNMEAELSALRTKLEKAQAPQPMATRTAPVATPERSGPTVRVITAATAVQAGLPRLTSFPNVVTGIIKDHENNLLPGVLVTVRDREDVPVRALKTNKLGQFAASTPLPNGTYFVEVEDPRNRYVFDRVQITFNGGVLPAVEIIAKSQRQLSRESLEKQIFGNQRM